MGAPVTSSQFVRLLDKRLRDVAMKEYNDLPTMIPTIFNMMPSQAAWEEFFSVSDVPDVEEFNGKMTRLAIYPGFHIKIEPKEYGNFLEYERKLVDDEQYGVMSERASGLMRAFQRTREKQGVRLFANSSSIAFDYQTHEEGVALCSSSHTNKTGASTSSGFDNSGTSSMTKTSVAATRILMRQFRSDIGERIEISDDLAIVCPDNLADTADEIVGTPKGYATAEHTKNKQYMRYDVIPYLRLDDYDSNDWYMVDKKAMKRNAIWIDRVKPEIETERDYMTKAIRTSVYGRFAYGYRDWRWIYKHVVS